MRCIIQNKRLTLDNNQKARQKSLNDSNCENAKILYKINFPKRKKGKSFI